MLCPHTFSTYLQKKRIKFDNKSTKCIFIGYSSETKGYRLFDVESDKLIVSRDVLDEKASWDWNNKKVQERPFVTVQDHMEDTEVQEDPIPPQQVLKMHQQSPLLKGFEV